jgi:hypothetical protein
MIIPDTLSDKVLALLASRPFNRLTLVEVEPRKAGQRERTRLVTLQCSCGAHRCVKWSRLREVKSPVFACESCTRLIGYADRKTPRDSVNPDLLGSIQHLAYGS